MRIHFVSRYHHTSGLGKWFFRKVSEIFKCVTVHRNFAIQCVNYFLSEVYTLVPVKWFLRRNTLVWWFREICEHRNAAICWADSVRLQVDTHMGPLWSDFLKCVCDDSEICEHRNAAICWADSVRFQVDTHMGPLWSDFLKCFREIRVNRESLLVSLQVKLMT